MNLELQVNKTNCNDDYLYLRYRVGAQEEKELSLVSLDQVSESTVVTCGRGGCLFLFRGSSNIHSIFGVNLMPSMT